METNSIIETKLTGLRLVGRGKVRDIYEVDDSHLLIVATDRISAFDVIMPNPIPGKGEILTRMSVFWFALTRYLVQNHLVTDNPEDYPSPCIPHKEILTGRSMLVKKANPLPVECVVRGYLSGSGWKDYLRNGMVSGVRLPAGLKESAKLDAPIFTPATKAQEGQHDLPMTRGEMENVLGTALTTQLETISLAIYERAASYAEEKGIIIADSKFEFGLLDNELILIDELLTPDSSRFWPRDEYQEGRPQRSFDKQYLRDYLLGINWNQRPPAPILPEDVVQKTKKRYEEAFRLFIA